MDLKSPLVPGFFIDSLPDIPNTACRELLRSIEMRARPSEIFAWLKQFRVAPYSYDFIDNRRRKSPDYIIENLPPLKVNTHFLLAFHIVRFEEDSFIVCRFCEPINKPIDHFMKDMFIEYRITGQGPESILWCKIKGYFNKDIFSKGFFVTFSIANKIMMTKQLEKIKHLSELLRSGKANTGLFDMKDCYPKTGIHWWIFCRRHNCKGLLTHG